MENSKIQWTDHTFNPWIGCTKVSAGCQNCYAEAQMDKWLQKAKWGPNGTRVKTVASNWKKVSRWDAKLNGTGRRERVFIASLADVFEKNDNSDIAYWRFDLWNLIEKLDNLDCLLLTKRPENILDCVPCIWHNQWARGPIQVKWPKHIWTGASVENQAAADKRIPVLVKVPGRHFLSLEPLLSPINLDLTGIDWVIIGGESGPNARLLDLAWIEDISRQCRAANIPAFVKQLGSAWAKETQASHSKGGDPDEWPELLRIRMFPGEAYNGT